MTIHVHAGDRPDGEPPRNLTDACVRHHERLARISLRVRRGRQGYAAIDRHVDVIQPGESEVLDDDDVSPSSAVDISQAVWDSAVEHAASHGPAYYQAELFDRDQRRLEKIAFQVSQGEDGRVEMVEGVPRENEIVDMARLAGQMAKDSHSKHMVTMDKLTGMMDGFAKMADVQGKMHVEIARFEHDFRMKSLELQQQMDDNEASVEKWKAGVSPMVAIGKQVGDILGQFVAAKLSEFGASADGSASSTSTSTSTSTGAAIRKIWDDSHKTIIVARMEEIDPELVTLWENLLQSDDQAIRNMWSVFLGRARATRPMMMPEQLFIGAMSEGQMRELLELLA